MLTSQLIPIKKNVTPNVLIANLRRLFADLSTGHKAIMNIVASLSLHLKTNSLVLMDEPEVHLHPPLVSALLKVVRELLGKFQAHAIVATHSPIVVQETLGRHVIVMTRYENRTNWQSSDRETFGENLATIIRETLGLPAANADYVGQLAALIDKDTQLEDIERIFGERGMSSPARAQTLRIISALQADRKN